MQNINGEEINEALFNKKLNEILKTIQDKLEDKDLSDSFIDDTLTDILSFGVIEYTYGSFIAKQDLTKS